MSNRKSFISSVFLLGLFVFAPSICVEGQQERYNSAKSQEISEVDGIPVLIKHLPEWESVKTNAIFITDRNELKAAIGERSINELVDFAGGTEAVAAKYSAGTVLIVEYTNPQLSIAADQNFRQRIESDASVIYRRIGNYSAFVFDASELAAGNALLDQVKYEKQVQWLGEDPFLLQKIERYFAQTGRDVVFSTILWIALIFAITIALGCAAGFAYFRYRESKRAGMRAFSDAGGLTRLNLDELSEPLP